MWKSPRGVNTLRGTVKARSEVQELKALAVPHTGVSRSPLAR